MAKMHVRRDDTVAVISGEDRGKKGKILEVYPKTGRVIVDGVNIQKKHTRPTQQNPQGGIIEKPGPISASNVALVCPSCKEPTRVKRVRQDGNLIRHCKKCGKAID
ncbi:MAG: 50S ribosomal protein L24 [Bacillota bacterium]|jgi:large subunit ribosomal protein L24|nr:50S ribosomal protein L24 [Bacillota bacterium]